MVITITNWETEAWKAYLTFSELFATKVAKQRDSLTQKTMLLITTWGFRRSTRKLLGLTVVGP